jgi:hypothetical protein
MNPDDVHNWQECQALANNLDLKIHVEPGLSNFRISKELVPGATVTLGNVGTVPELKMFLKGYERGLHVARTTK